MMYTLDKVDSTKTKVYKNLSKAGKFGMFVVFIAAVYKVSPVCAITFGCLFGLDLIVDVLLLQSEANDYVTALTQASEKMERDILGSGHA